MAKMEIDIIASSKPFYKVSKRDALLFGGKCAGICYLQGDRDVLREKEEKTQKRVELTLTNGHHSVYEHCSVTLHIKNLPKILSIILVAEKQYSASIKSGRYTVMTAVEDNQRELYDKWLEIFDKRIKEVHPEIPDRLREKLSMENARSVISVFTPTQGIYTINIRQLNYIVHWFTDFIKQNSKKKDFFHTNLIKSMKEFINLTKEYHIENMTSGKGRGISLFKKDYLSYSEYFGDTYSTNYFSSFVQLEQILRHRTINYTILSDIGKIPKKFFVPPILDKKSKEDWLSDLNSIKDVYPNASLVEINERGMIEDFILKCYERLCGNAQLETMLQTKKTLRKYIDNTKGDTKEELEKYYSASCLYKDKVCKMPCIWGGKRGVERDI